MLDIKKGAPLPTVEKIEENRGYRVARTVNLPNDRIPGGYAIPWRPQFIGVIAQLLPVFESASLTGQELGCTFDSYHYLSLIIYLLSNNHIMRGYQFPSSESREDIEEILDITFRFVSREVLLALLQSRLPSIKAAWRTLLLGAGNLTNEEAFRVLINVGMNNAWLNEQFQGHEHLFYAIQINCEDVFHALLARGCRADSSFGACQGEPAIMAAIKHGNLHHARLLIQHCDVNQKFQPSCSTNNSTNFSYFITHFESKKMDYHRCLDFFLEYGADVDYELSLDHLERHIQLNWTEAKQSGFLEGWTFSILDYVFYFQRPLFLKLAPFSKVSARFSRARALWCLEEGVHVLREYLDSDLAFACSWWEAMGKNVDNTNAPERKNHCLEVLLAEQFLLSFCSPDRKLCWKTVQGLFELGIDLSWSSEIESLAAIMLCATAQLIASGEGPERAHGLQILQRLLSQGFEVKADALSAAVQDHGVEILECLAGYCSDLKKHGTFALAEAASRDNFDATRLLLLGGVDPSSSIAIANQDTTTALEVAVRGSTLAMMKYLVQHTDSLKGLNSSHLLMDMFCSHVAKELSSKVQYLIDERVTMTDSISPSARFLETCLNCIQADLEERKTIFELLLEGGARLSPGSPLAEWIAAGGSHQLVHKMLDAGSDVNAYSFETNPKGVACYHIRRTPLQAAAGQGDYTLVCLLLERGADLNRPALGSGGRTALQAICAWDPVRPEERTRKERIIKLLLDKGADVNATNYNGWTSLTFAAYFGELSTAFLLLKYGAEVNVSSSSRNPRGFGTALDNAAAMGRLDMVDFLLNANALSWSAGPHGKHYDGAIQRATTRGHFEVAELIHKHSAGRKRWDVPREPAVERSISPDHTSQPLSLRAESGTSSWSYTERRLTPSEDSHGIAVPDQIDGPRYAIDGAMVESGTAASEANGKGIPGAGSTDMSWTHVIEEIEDEPSLAGAGCERAKGVKRGGHASQSSGAREASSGPRGWLYRPTDQNWVEDEQQRVDPIVSSHLTTDVFMGFPGFPSL